MRYGHLITLLAIFVDKRWGIEHEVSEGVKIVHSPDLLSGWVRLVQGILKMDAPQIEVKENLYNAVFFRFTHKGLAKDALVLLSPAGQIVNQTNEAGSI